MSVNIPLLRKAVEWAEAEANKPIEEREWYQGAWVQYRGAGEDPYLLPNGEYGLNRQVVESQSCGTAYCVAGYVAALDNPEVYQFTHGGYPWDFENQTYARDEHGLMLPHASTYAKNALGLSEGQADRLFNGDNTIEDVRAIAEAIAENAGERL